MKGPKVVIVLAGGLLALSLLVTCGSLLLPIVNAGKASWEEAALGFVPGALCSLVSLVGLGIGIIWLLAGKKS